MYGTVLSGEPVEEMTSGARITILDASCPQEIALRELTSSSACFIIISQNSCHEKSEVELFLYTRSINLFELSYLLILNSNRFTKHFLNLILRIVFLIFRYIRTTGNYLLIG